MDCRTGDIYRTENTKRFEELCERERLAPLTEQQATRAGPLTKYERKNYMRNQPCVCGSGTKFKRCCWSKFA